MNGKQYDNLNTMTASEKTLLYNLLKTASDNINGYSSPDFPTNTPVFTDDKPQANDGNIIQSANTVQHTNTEQPANTTTEKTCDAPLSDAPLSDAQLSIAEKIAQCNRCILCKTRTNTVPGEGVEKPAVLVIGEGPGADEDASGRPFVGKAGQLLDKMLAAIQLDRTKNCFIANIVKCRPPNNRDPLPEESEACSSFLQAQITVLKPALILCVGRIAAQNLLKTETGINRLRGTFYDYNGIPTLCTYHPSALLRNADLKRPAWEDLKMFKAKLETLVPDYANSTNNAAKI